MRRYFFSALFGLLSSVGLFALMQFMIMNDQQGFKETKSLRMVEFVRLKRESKIETKSRKPPQPPPQPKQKPPPPKMPVQQAKVTQQAPDMAIPNLDIPVQTRFGGALLDGVQVDAGNMSGAAMPGLGAVSTNLIPLLRIPPRYPRRAASRHIEGWVRVEFTITREGTVKDARVVDAQPKSIFNRAALRAIAKWKFKPKMVNGKAVEQRAAQILQFKLR